MEKLIKNTWGRESGAPFERATILQRHIHPEGLDAARLRFRERGQYEPRAGEGHLISVLSGEAKLHGPKELAVEAGVHVYVPAAETIAVEGTEGTELLVVSAPAEQARGTRLILRDEQFVSACATKERSLRWILTPQYLSRRIFLFHDEVLLSKQKNPVSLFRTTMFDVSGLPKNDEGEPVFKMSYNYRTEPNICYDVEGKARVRMAVHPYKAVGQQWGPWLDLDGDTTYHLNEPAGGTEEEWFEDELTKRRRPLRNKHEVQAIGGHVTLVCLFDPAPTGAEQHRAGEYSEYGPLSDVVGTERYDRLRQELLRYDAMVERLSYAKASGALEAEKETEAWALYLEGREAQQAHERSLHEELTAEGNGRARVIADWMR